MTAAGEAERGRSTPDAAAPAFPTCSLAVLSEGELSVLEAVVESKWAWVARIYFVLKHREADVASLASRGLVDCFDEALAAMMSPRSPRSPHSPPGPGVTLTPYAAWLLKVELVPCVNSSAAETDRSRWQHIKFDADGKRLKERRGHGVKVPRSFGSLHLPQREAEAILDGNPGPEYLIDEFNGERVMCFSGGNVAGANTSPGAILLGGIGGGGATRGVPILRDKRLKGKK